MTTLLFALAVLLGDGTWKEHIDAGNRHLNAGEYRAAERSYSRALDALSTADSQSGELAATCNNLASAYQELGREREAERLYLRSIQIWRSLGQPEAAARPLNNVGILYRRQRRYSEAERVLRESYDLRLRALPPGHPDIARVQHNLGRVYQGLADLARSEQLHREAAAALERHPALKSELAGVLAHLGNVQRLAKSAEAPTTLQRATEMATSALTPDHPLWVDVSMCTAALHIELRDWSRAESDLRRAVQIAEAKLGSQHPVTGNALAHYAVVLKKQGRAKEAKALESRSREVLKSHRGEYTVDVAELTGNSR